MSLDNEGVNGIRPEMVGCYFLDVFYNGRLENEIDKKKNTIYNKKGIN